MQKLPVIAAAVTAITLTVFGPTAAANAATVSNPGPPTSSFSPFGPYFTSVYGQTVTAPARSTALNAFSFQIESSGPMVVRGEVYAWDGHKATGPALFESDPLTLVGDSTAHVVSFRTGGTELRPGSEYVLFATLLRDVQPDSPDSSAWPTTGDVMPGQVVFLNARSFDQVTSTPWDAAPSLDLMYTAEFEAAPTVRSVTPARGDIGGGSTITVTGADLSGTTAVTVGGHTATDVRVVSDGEVTATVPAGVAGTADVTVTTPRGTDTATDAYTYYTAHAPSAPSAPRDLTAVAGDADVALRWAAPTDDGGSTVTGYAVQQYVDRSWRTVTTTSATTATIAGLRNGMPTAFRVAAITSAGTGAPTEVVNATPFVFTPIVTAGGRPLTTGRPLAAGDTLVVEDEALPVGATVSVGLDSAPTSIGTATVASNGTVRVTGTIPASTTIGDHTLVTALTLVDGTAGGATATPLTVRAATVNPAPITPSAAPTTTPVTVAAAGPAAPSAGELATTGTDVTPAIEAALALVTAGVGVLALARQRRERSGA
ncbi:IPT/TIG domain-containing protein [Curtobacterium sp. AB7]|uniref:IPT/TIG domain-containing protein n=1 Tax=Curtobacterium sp. AB7 TaxID=3349327 RepID=UPI00383851B6